MSRDPSRDRYVSPPLTSLASSRYAIAPREVGSNTVMGCPNDGASEIRTVRGITILHTRAPKWASHLGRHLVCKLGPGVVHGQHDRRDFERLVEVALNQLDVAEQLAQTLQCVVLALDRDEDLACRRKSVDSYETQATAGSRSARSRSRRQRSGSPYEA